MTPSIAISAAMNVLKKVVAHQSTDLVTRGCPEPDELNGMWDCTLLSNGWNRVWDQVYAARSKHVGGVHASLCDGSARSYSEEIDALLWQAISRTQGNERPFGETP